MAKAAVVNAVKARLAANWTECPVVEENTSTARPKNGSAFIVAQFPVANTLRMTHSRTYREEGAFRIVIFTEKNVGLSKAVAWGDELCDLFRDVKFDGVESLRPTSPAVSDDNDEAIYFRTSVVVPYRYDFTG